MVPTAQSCALARLFTVVLGVLLWWPSLGSPAQLGGEATAQRGDFAPVPGDRLGRDALTAEEMSESDDTEDARDAGSLADSISRQLDPLAQSQTVDRVDPAQTTLASAWRCLPRERGPPLS